MSCLDNTGELSELIARMDWSATALGPIEAWPQSVKSTVSLILHSTFPIATMWGEAGVMIYNSGYAEIAADKHPGLLGTEVREAWPEARDFNAEVPCTALDPPVSSAPDDSSLPRGKLCL